MGRRQLFKTILGALGAGAVASKAVAMPVTPAFKRIGPVSPQLQAEFGVRRYIDASVIKKVAESCPSCLRSPREICF